MTAAGDRAAHFQAVLDRYQADRRLPSLVVGVLDAGDVAWTGTAGDVGATTETQYRIGSITKVFTALAVMRLRDGGELDLDDPVGKFLPESGYGEATLRQLLSHTAGLQSEPVGPWWERSPGGPVETLLAANDGSGRVFAPEETYHYSNLGYGLLGEVVARLEASSWWEAVNEWILDYLGMWSTTYHPQPLAARGFSVHHLEGTLTFEPGHDTGGMAPAGQLWSTVDDLVRFAKFLMHGNEIVLSHESLAEMRQPVPPALEYGLGVRLLPFADGVLVGHTGSMPGFQSTLFVDPLNGVGVVALTNATTGFSGSELALALLGDHTPGPVPAWVPTTTVPDWAAELLGYWHWGNSAYEVRWHNERLEWRDLGRTGAVAEQFELHGDGIVGVAGYHHGETLQVVRRADGSIERLECATFVYTREPYAGQR